MSGRIDETYFSKLKERKLSDQSEIDDFTDDETTYVAVVREPHGGIEEIVDEVWPEVGMPSEPLHTFLERRSGYRTNSAVDDPHNKAYRDTNLHGIYQQYINTSKEAESRLHEAVDRVVSGENIVLVCYEEEGNACHRHMLVDIIRERVQSRENCKFTLRS